MALHYVCIQTPLHLAIITRQPHIVQLLVQAGASVNFPDRKGNTALHLASARRDMQILQMLARATSPVPDFNCKNFAGTLLIEGLEPEWSNPSITIAFSDGLHHSGSKPFRLARVLYILQLWSRHTVSHTRDNC